MDIEKNTIKDKERMLRRALELKHGGWMKDFDDTKIFFEKWEDNSYSDKSVSYTISDNFNITIGDDLTDVVELTEFKEVSKSLTDKLESWLDKNFGASKEQTLQVIKQFDEEEMISVEPLFISVGEVDGQGDTIDSLEEMENLVKSFNEANEAGTLQSSLFHKHKTNTFSVIKAWVNPCECMIGETLVPETQPIVKIKFNDAKAWELRKQGTLMGLSIGARAKEVEIINE